MSAPALPPTPPTTAEGLLPVGEGHEIFWEESGTADGVPTLYLHGGPGGRLTPATGDSPRRAAPGSSACPSAAPAVPRPGRARPDRWT